jgi:hypothetical protein
MVGGGVLPTGQHAALNFSFAGIVRVINVTVLANSPGEFLKIRRNFMIS